MPNIFCNSFIVAGTKYCCEAGELRLFAPGETLRLIREPENKHDKNAIAVHAPVNSMLLHIGYVPAVLAKYLSPMMAKGLKLSAIVQQIEPIKLIVWAGLVWEKEDPTMVRDVDEFYINDDYYEESSDDLAS